MKHDYRKYVAPIISFLFLGLMFIFNQTKKESNPKAYDSNDKIPNEIDTTKRPETGEIRFDNPHDSEP